MNDTIDKLTLLWATVTGLATATAAIGFALYTVTGFEWSERVMTIGGASMVGGLGLGLAMLLLCNVADSIVRKRW